MIIDGTMLLLVLWLLLQLGITSDSSVLASSCPCLATAVGGGTGASAGATTASGRASKRLQGGTAGSDADLDARVVDLVHATQLTLLAPTSGIQRAYKPAREMMNAC